MAMSSVVTSEDQKEFVTLLTDVFFAERHELGLVAMCIEREMAEIGTLASLATMLMKANREQRASRLCLGVADCLQPLFRLVSKGEASIICMRRCSPV